jgi:hypothetical protein
MSKSSSNSVAKASRPRAIRAICSVRAAMGANARAGRPRHVWGGLLIATIVAVHAATFAQTSQPSGADRSAPARQSLPPSEPRYNYRDRYALLAEHNIFLKDRTSHRDGERRNGSSTTQPGATPRTPEQLYVLTGVVLEGGERRAYFEDLEHGGLVKVGVGDALAKGRVVEIDIDAVAFAQDERPQVWIGVGSDLTGAASAAVQTLAQAAPSTAPSGPTIDPNARNLTVEQRMMLRRQQEQQRMNRR